MTFTRRALIGTMLAFGLVTGAAAQDDGVHRLALQISDNDPAKMNTLLNVATNVSKHYQDEGAEIEIRVVAFNAGVHMLRDDTSPVLERLKSFGQSMPHVSFVACGITIDTMARNEGTPPPISAYATRVPAGVVELMTLDEEGWTIIRP